MTAITEMPPPADKKGLQRLLGMTLTAPLRTLLRKDIMWQWQPEHKVALDRLKAVISSTPLLKFFNPREEIEN